LTTSVADGYNTLSTEHFPLLIKPEKRNRSTRKGSEMYRFIAILGLVFAVVLFGCGEPSQEAGTDTHETGEATDVTGDDTGDVDVEDNEDIDTDDNEMALAGDFDFETPDLAVGQWVTYGVSNETGTVTLSVVGEENFEGVDCLWLQFEGDDFVAQILVDPAGLETAMAGYQDEFGRFLADPADYLRTQVGSGDMGSMLMSEENVDKSMSFIRALKMVKFDNDGMVLALDLTGVADMIEPYLSDPEMLTSGLGIPETGQPDMEGFIAELDNITFSAGETDVMIGGNTLDAWQFSMSHPEGEIVFTLSDDIPILPIASISVAGTGEGDSGSLFVVDFGYSGAVSKLGDPAQVIDASLFLQGALAQVEAMNANAPATP